MKNLNQAKSVVIGGSGFIGESLCLALRNTGETVINLSREKSDKLNEIEQISMDVNDKINLVKSLRGASDVFILVGQINKNFNKSVELDNLASIVNAVDYTSAKRIFYFSSTLIYGDTKDLVDENIKPSPLDDYSNFKVESENFLREAFQKTDISLLTLRLSNVYGGVKNKGLIGLIFNNIVKGVGDGIKLNGDGMQSRDYIYLDDVIDAILSIKKKAMSSDLVNISSGKNYSLIDVIEGISIATGKKISYEISGDNFDQIRSNLISNKKLISKYGFVPKHDLASGLKLTFEKYKNY